MPRIAAVAVICGGADDGGEAIITQRHRRPGLVAFGFTIDLATTLQHPGRFAAVVPRVDPCMPRIVAVAAVFAVVAWGADDRSEAISTQRHRRPGIVV